uniref:Uncharacterized protein n=1 Tax=Anguilla anguilla TaxID=7936 RepID=A0A0E9VPY6_ANGAN
MLGSCIFQVLFWTFFVLMYNLNFFSFRYTLLQASNTGVRYVLYIIIIIIIIIVINSQQSILSKTEHA